MSRRTLALGLFCWLAVLSGTPSSAGTFELLGTNADAAAQPSNWGKILRGLYGWNGRMFMGYGDYGANTGPISVTAYNPANGQFETFLKSGTHSIEHFREIRGRLYAPLSQPMSCCSVFAAGNPWRDEQVDSFIHVYDVATLDGADLWVAGSQGDNAAIYRSRDGGTTWELSLSVPPVKSGDFSRFYFAGVYNGKLYVQACDYSSYLQPQSKVFDGTSWSDGPNLFPNANFSLGYHPSVFAGKMVYVSWEPPSSGALFTFDGTKAAMGAYSTYLYAIDNGYLYILDTTRMVRRTQDLVTWTAVAQAPSNATGIGILNGYIYVGTSDSKLYRYTDPVTPPATLPVLSVASSDPNAAEAGANPGAFTISRAGDTSQALTVNLRVTGLATNGVDFQPINNAVVIPAGADSVTVPVIPLDDTTAEGDESVILTIAAGPYMTAVQMSATVTIADDDLKAGGDRVWFDDKFLDGVAAFADNESWNWVAGNPAPHTGPLAHQSALASAMHQHKFAYAADKMSLNAGESVVLYVYIDPANPPREILVHWKAADESWWEHRAYWGENLIGWGTDGTAARHYAGPLPPAGQWARLSVPAADLDLEGRTLDGMDFTLWDGRVTFDSAGKTNGPPGNAAAVSPAAPLGLRTR